MKNFSFLLASVLVIGSSAQGVQRAQQAQLALDEGWNDIELQALTRQAQGNRSIVPQPEQGWYTAKDHELANTFGDLTWNPQTRKGVHQFKLYTPENVNLGVMPLAIIFVHGTFAKADNDEFGKEDNAQGLLPKALRFTKHLADKYGAATKFISFGWSGDEDDRARLAAGQTLGDIIRTHFKGYNVITVAHSHACNVLNHATHYLDEPLTMMIHLAGPVIQGNGAPFYTPENFVYLLNFYSTGDFVQALGGTNWHKIHLHKVSNFGSSIKKLFGKNNAQNLPGNFANNSGWFTGFLAPERRILNTFTQDEHRRIGRIMNIRTQVNGVDPDHSFIKHAVVDNLAAILEKLNIYTFHNDLDLNIIDAFTARPTEAAFAASASPVLLAIRNGDAFAEKDTLAISEETRYSNKQKEYYQKLYSKNIADKGAMYDRVRLNLSNLWRVAKG